MRIFIPAGSSIKDVASISKIYRFPKFAQGKIFFRDGRISTSLLNYNFLTAEIEFISPQGDTLAIADDLAPTIKYLLIDSATFYYYNGYLEKVMENSNGKVLKRQQYLVERKDKLGSLNQASTGAIDTYSSLSDNNSGVMPYNLVVRQNITLAIKTELFLGDLYDDFRISTKKNLLKMFSKKKDAIEDFLKTHHVDFNNEEDLKNLLAHM